jgi:hypothetical protein
MPAPLASCAGVVVGGGSPSPLMPASCRIRSTRSAEEKPAGYGRCCCGPSRDRRVMALVGAGSAQEATGKGGNPKRDEYPADASGKEGHRPHPRGQAPAIQRPSRTPPRELIGNGLDPSVTAQDHKTEPHRRKPRP